MKIKGINYWKEKRKTLKEKKREIMKRDFQSSKDRKNTTNSFKREYRALKRAEKNEFKKDIKDGYGI